MSKKFEVVAISGLPEFGAGDNLGEAILSRMVEMGLTPEDGDIFVVSQKVVSKVEGRTVRLADIKPSERALTLSKLTGKDPRFVELVLQESSRIEVAANGHLIVTTKTGITCANAGIDVSNVEGSGETVLLLPVDPDASARRIREYIVGRSGKKVGVVISDTHGRTLREGQINVAIGLSGVKPFKDYRGTADMKGYVLRVKMINIADELASAAELVIGQATERTPVALVRGLGEIVGEYEGSSVLNMPQEKWLFKPVGITGETRNVSRVG
ncbi:MAG: coenzyme F420-0:L-glutamate ligase [Thermoprotei archaeon]